jgi:hypothetical protein
MKIGAKWVGTSDEDGDRPKTTDGGFQGLRLLTKLRWHSETDW